MSPKIDKAILDQVVESASVTVESTTFPVECFPEEIQEIIRECKRCLNFPIDFTAASILFATATCIGNSLKVQVKNGWQEGCTVFIALVGRPGTNKSHPLSFAIKPILKRDSQLFEKYKSEIEVWKQTKENGENEECQPKPTLSKHLVSDATIEALSTVHNDNPRGLGVYSDELMGWLKKFNRYHSGSEMEDWLSIWSAKPIFIDRRTQEPIRIDKPAISVCGTLQENLLGELHKAERKWNGFTDRILMVVPSNLKKECWTNLELPLNLIHRWEEIVERLIYTPVRNDSEALRFSSSGWRKLKEWQAYNTKCCNDAETQTIASAFTKLEIYCIRFCLILQVLEDTTTKTETRVVDERAVENATKLIEYFRSMILSVENHLKSISPVDELDQERKLLYELLDSVFTTNEIQELAKEHQVLSKASITRFLKNDEVFQRIGQGRYRKLY